MARVHFHLIVGLLLAGSVIPAPAIAGPAEDAAAAQSALATAELDRLKTLQGMLAPPAGVAEGKATLTDIESGAEVLQLRHQVENHMAASLASGIGGGGGRPILLIFGNQPPTTAHYLSIRRGVIELEKDSKTAVEMAREVFKPKKVKPPHHMFALEMAEMGELGGALGPAGVGLTAVSTLVSLLRVDTEMKGAALASNAEALGPIVSEALAGNGWRVQAPSRIARSTPYADSVVERLRPVREEAAKYYAIYLAHLSAKGDKPETLPEAERIAGQALATVMANHAALMSGLYVPVNGLLPATVIEEEKALAEASPDKSILYIQSHEAAMTSITKKGFLTGIIGVPAYVSASSVVSYTYLDGNGARFGSVSYHTPVMRVTGVAQWVDSQPPPAQRLMGLESASAAGGGGSAN